MVGESIKECFEDMLGVAGCDADGNKGSGDSDGDSDVSDTPESSSSGSVVTVVDEELAEEK